MANKLTQKQLKKLFTSLNGDPLELTIQTVTTPHLVGRGKPKNVLKISTVKVKVNFDYEKEVNHRRIDESKKPNFKSEERAWGQHQDGTPLITHNDELYLNCMVLETYGSLYFKDGVEVDESEVSPWFPKQSAGRQRLRQPVIVRSYKLDSVRSIIHEGDVYSIKR